MIAASQASTLLVLAARLRTRVSKGSHKSEVLELIDLLDAALADAPEALPPASPPAPVPPNPTSEPADAAVERLEVVCTTERGAGAACFPTLPLNAEHEALVEREFAAAARRQDKAIIEDLRLQRRRALHDPAADQAWLEASGFVKPSAPTPALDVAALHDIARAAREASLALDTLTQRLKHALESGGGK